MIYIIFYLLVGCNAEEYACGAGPLIYGPECAATDCIDSAYYDSIVYVIDEIISSTNIECEAKGFNNVFSCHNNKFTWYPLGVLQEGESSTLFWGNNIGCPEIKCKGQPSATVFKWSWKIIPDNKICCGDNTCLSKCCGGACMKDNDTCCWDNLCLKESQSCCGGICYDANINHCCSAGTKDGHNIYYLCDHNSRCTGYLNKCCPNTCITCCANDDGSDFSCAKKGQSCCNGKVCDDSLYCCNNLKCTTWEDCH
jgi:hypothetical protein